MPRITREAQVKRDQQIMEYLKQSIPQVQIAKMVGASASTVNKLAKKVYNKEEPVKKESNTLDTNILKKLIPVFIENRMQVKLDKPEIERIKQLYLELSQKKKGRYVKP